MTVTVLVGSVQHKQYTVERMNILMKESGSLITDYEDQLLTSPVAHLGRRLHGPSFAQ